MTAAWDYAFADLSSSCTETAPRRAKSSSTGFDDGLSDEAERVSIHLIIPSAGVFSFRADHNRSRTIEGWPRVSTAADEAVNSVGYYRNPYVLGLCASVPWEIFPRKGCQVLTTASGSVS